MDDPDLSRLRPDFLTQPWNAAKPIPTQLEAITVNPAFFSAQFLQPGRVFQSRPGTSLAVVIAGTKSQGHLNGFQMAHDPRQVAANGPVWIEIE
jgi:hypothetical protein